MCIHDPACPPADAIDWWAARNITEHPVTPGTPGGGPDSSVEQAQYVFHELHAEGRHALCAVCGGR
jgi:hypothetical protein